MIIRLTRVGNRTCIRMNQNKWSSEEWDQIQVVQCGVNTSLLNVQFTVIFI